MKNFLVSLLTIGLVGGAVYGATSAFFSDTEVSTGNTIMAGDIDLRVGNSSYYWNYSTLSVVESTETSWPLSDLGGENLFKFFDFDDVKPGDWGEDTITLQVTSNEAYMCAQISPIIDNENGVNEAEVDANDTSTGTTEGELSNEMQFFFWVDDGDNVFEDEEAPLYGETTVPGSVLVNGDVIALQDSQYKLFEPSDNGVTADQPYHIGKVWCLGDLDVEAVAGFDLDDNPIDTPPTERWDGVTCNGAGVSNQVQTDSMVADISFYAVQTRNNPSFLCSSLVEVDEEVVTPQP